MRSRLHHPSWSPGAVVSILIWRAQPYIGLHTSTIQFSPYTPLMSGEVSNTDFDWVFLIQKKHRSQTSLFHLRNDS